MNIHVIGTGYVGLVTALSFCHYGHHLTCWDIDKNIIENLNAGNIHFFEPGCKELLAKALKDGKIVINHMDNFSLKYDDELVFICVGTPTIDEKIDLQYVVQAVRTVGANITASANPSIIVKSTVVPGTTADLVFKEVHSKLSDKSLPINLGMSPEFLREGSAVQDCLNPDRVVVGANTKITEQRVMAAYAPFNAKIFITSLSTAEFSKYANNSILALLISMSNELARVAHLRSDINIDQAYKIVGLDKRWRVSDELPAIFSYMYPGCGFGGSCFPKDIKALEGFSSHHGQQAPLLSSIVSTNTSQPRMCLNIINDWLTTVKTVGVLGLSFKPNTDDIRESPSIPIVNILSNSHDVFVHDPLVKSEAFKQFLICPDQVMFSPNISALLINVELVILVTPWEEYLNLHQFQISFKNKFIYDCRSALNSINYTNWNYRSYSRKEFIF